MSSTQLELNGAPHWIDQVADLLPEERRLAWYRDLNPWLRGLPPQDELQDRLSRLPAEIAKGVSPQALAAQMVEGLRQQFHQSGMPDITLQLREQAKELRTVVATQSASLADLKSKVESTTQKAQLGIEMLDRKAAAAVRESEQAVTDWNKTTSKTMLMLQILTLLIVFLLGVAFCWSFPRTITQQVPVPVPSPGSAAPKMQPTPPAKKSAKRTHANSAQTEPK